MIAPWQVWDMDDSGHPRPFLVVSSDTHLTAQQGRMALGCVLTSVDRQLRNRVPVVSPLDGGTFWVITERISATNSRNLMRMVWTLTEDEIEQCRIMLRAMVDF